MYRIRVGYGTAGQPGTFTLGANVHPAAPLDRYYVCGQFVNDVLSLEYSPYTIDDPVAVAGGTTVSVEPGVTVMFGAGGSIRAGGLLAGSGAPGLRILLRPLPPVQKAAAGAETAASAPVTKEVRP